MQFTLKQIWSRIKFKEVLFLLLITTIGFALRFYNLNWDKYFPAHPDERPIVGAISRIILFKNYDPGFYIYGGFPIYLVSLIKEKLFYLLGDSSWRDNLYKIHLLTRGVSVVSSTLLIPLIYLIAKKIFDKKVVIISSLGTVFVAGFIQYAHFGVFDSLTLFLTFLIFYFSIILWEKFSYKKLILVGVLSGLCVGSRLQTIYILIAPLTVLLAQQSKNRSIFDLVKKIGLLIIIFFFVYVLVNPYVLVNYQTYFQQVVNEAKIASGQQSVSYTLQFLGQNSYLNNLKNLYWLVGPGIVIGVLGYLLTFIQGIRTKNFKYLLWCAVPLVYFLWICTWKANFIRYALPLIPVLIVGGAYLTTLIKKRMLIFVCGSIYILIILGWALAFFTIYTKESTTVSASNWIYANVKPQSKILTEALDLKLPLSLPAKSSEMYKSTELAMTESDTKEKIQLLANELTKSDYLIFASPRFWKNIPKAKGTYPYSTKYYQVVFNGNLGFEKVAEFNAYPQIGKLIINDDGAEETFKVFDHPGVLIFKNTKKYSEKQIFNLIMN